MRALPCSRTRQSGLHEPVAGLIVNPRHPVSSSNDEGASLPDPWRHPPQPPRSHDRDQRSGGVANDVLIGHRLPAHGRRFRTDRPTNSPTRIGFNPRLLPSRISRTPGTSMVPVRITRPGHDFMTRHVPGRRGGMHDRRRERPAPRKGRVGASRNPGPRRSTRSPSVPWRTTCVRPSPIEPASRSCPQRLCARPVSRTAEV
jgi:hypothetical protein